MKLYQNQLNCNDNHYYHANSKTNKNKEDKHNNISKSAQYYRLSRAKLFKKNYKHKTQEPSVKNDLLSLFLKIIEKIEEPSVCGEFVFIKRSRSFNNELKLSIIELLHHLSIENGILMNKLRSAISINTSINKLESLITYNK